MYEGSLVNLVTVLELTQKPDGTMTFQTKQLFLCAVREQHNAGGMRTRATLEMHLLGQKTYSFRPPGGELLVEERDEVIELVKCMKDLTKDVRVSTNFGHVHPTDP